MNQSSFSCCCFIPSERFEIDGKPTAAILTCIWTVPSSITATLGNLLVLISFWRTPSLHTPSNVLLINLAVTDFGAGLIAAPLFLVSNIAKVKEDEDMFCKFTPVYTIASFCVCGVSLFTLTAISLERYFALRVHLRYNEIVTVRRVSAVAVGIWLFCLIGGAAAAIWTFTVIDVASVIAIPLCFLLTTFCYCETYRVVRRHLAQISAQLPATQSEKEETENSLHLKKYKKSFFDTLLVYCVFLLHYTPYLVISFTLLASGETVSLYAASGLAEALILMNATINPVLYCWRFRNIRVAVKDTARKLFCKINSQ